MFLVKKNLCDVFATSPSKYCLVKAGISVCFLHKNNVHKEYGYRKRKTGTMVQNFCKSTGKNIVCQVQNIILFEKSIFTFNSNNKYLFMTAYNEQSAFFVSFL
jgi:hypothetical protein